ncbi:MAG: DNA alkylation response protein, partial [Hyphomicrobiales bacterium]|nr:DNA alkylation response protein [Hyphomicrobiales bacterium]
MDCRLRGRGFQVNSAADVSANQSPPFYGVNLFSSDPALNTLVDGVPQTVIEQLAGHGQAWGTAETFELGRLANAHPPVLKAYDAIGNRIDNVEFHPAYHALMRRSIAAGLHASIWDAGEGEGSVRTLARAARMFMTVQAEAGHLGPMTTTTAAVAALAHAPDLASRWLPKIRG